jgi:hypothetical protein
LPNRGHGREGKPGEEDDQKSESDCKSYTAEEDHSVTVKSTMRGKVSDPTMKNHSSDNVPSRSTDVSKTSPSPQEEGKYDRSQGEGVSVERQSPQEDRDSSDVAIAHFS